MAAVIFDLDGTLIESSLDIKGMKKRLINYAFNLGFRSESLSVDDTTVNLVAKVHSYLFSKGRSEKFIERVMSDLNRIMDEFEIRGVEAVRALDQAKETLKEIKALGLKVGILTRSCETYSKRTLEITDMLQFIDAIEARRNLLEAKPNPMSLLFLCSRLETEPSNAIFVGDHPLDMECALKAGVPFVGFSNKPEKRKTLEENGCRLVLKELRDVLPIIKEKFVFR
ncbi:MAG: HAD family hydrolase [Candidatus Bathyarchaeia archaeon]